MKKIYFFTILSLLLIGNVFGQKKTVSAKPKPKVEVKTVLPNEEISETDWSILSDIVAAEDWNKSSNLALDYLKKLKVENNKRQIAQLNYIYIFSLQGKVSKGEETFEKFEEILQTFVGKEFMLPIRQILPNCKKVLNYICPSDNKDNSLFIAATNAEATTIHAFEYFKLNEKFDVEKNKNMMASLIGTLESFTVNPRKSNLWIAKLYFTKSQVGIIERELKEKD